MKDSLDILKDMIQNAALPLPDGDWAWFEARFSQRKRRRILAWISIPTFIAAGLTLLLVLDKPEKTGGQNNNRFAQNDNELSHEGGFEDADYVRKVEESKVGTRIRRTAVLAMKDLKEVPLDNTFVKEEQTDSEQKEESEESDGNKAGHEGDEINGSYDVNMYGDNKDNSSFTEFQIPKEAQNILRLAVSPYYKGSPFSKDEAKTIRLNGGEWGSSPTIYGSESGIETIRHLVPIHFGIDVSVPVSKDISLISGLDISSYRSLFSGENVSFVQQAYYIGIPLRLDWTFWESGPFSIWAGAGGKADRLLYCKYRDTNIKDNSMLWSVTAGAGIRYKLFDSVGLFLQPEVSYDINPTSSSVITYRTENPLTLCLRAGVGISL